MTGIDAAQAEAPGAVVGPPVVVVGDAELADRLGGDGGAVVVVDNYLQALGEMSRRSVAAVVGRIEPMRRTLEPTVAALRQMSPRAKMLLVADAADEPDAMRAVRLGFDDYFVEPLRGDELRQTLAQLSEALAEPVEVQSPSEAGGPKPSPQADDEHATEAAASIELNDDETDLPSGPVADVQEKTSPSPALAPASREDLPADARLLEHLLSRGGPLTTVLVDHLIETTGGAMAWSAEPDLDAGSCVPIAHGEQSFGYLLSEELTDQQLLPHAHWAARWLAMEQRLNALKHEANHDELTGAFNRRYFERFFASILRRAQQQRFRVTLLLFDIDDFKQYNDEYGHDAGDEILREAVRLMRSVLRRHDVVARIGGDEFAVIFWDAEAPRRSDSEHPHSVRRAAARFQKAICDQCFPKLAEKAPSTLTVSGGLASYPWDGRTAEELLKIADQMLLRSKRQGKNAMTFGPGADRICNGGQCDAGAADAHGT